MARSFHDLCEGDRIRVYSAGHRIDGEGTYLRFIDDGNEDFLYWINRSENINYTSLDSINIEKLRHDCYDRDND
ncbi:hypothetical protein II5_05852 [Bacillus cereus MSX-A1]|uniref:hypothetical protein n=1 Tax=Bacillus cereus TaxID=1396 RepID=UPI0002797495|nr:hypothetical protein [Bacillus cereus]EJQ98122.1 hypothetical protein II5_05852 [Bacillus cereus MSX-A1]MDR4293469.1 hypothetical protein [Bacillus cereus]